MESSLQLSVGSCQENQLSVVGSRLSVKLETEYHAAMISNAGIAAQISEVMQDVFHRIAESVDLVQKTCGEEEAVAYKKATAAIAIAIMDVCEPLYEKNPSLKPKGWDD
jgi:hypothetical protein